MPPSKPRWTTSPSTGASPASSLSNHGAGPHVDEKLFQLHTSFAKLIEKHLRRAVEEGSIPPIDTELAAYAWFGAINEVVIRWLYTGGPQTSKTRFQSFARSFCEASGPPWEKEESSVIRPAAAFTPSRLHQELVSMIAAGIQKAREAKEPVLVSYVSPFPDVAPETMAKALDFIEADTHFWAEPNGARTMLGAGEAWRTRPRVRTALPRWRQSGPSLWPGPSFTNPNLLP